MVQFASRHHELRSHSAVGVNAEHLQILATIRPTALAGEALLDSSCTARPNSGRRA